MRARLTVFLVVILLLLAYAPAAQAGGRAAPAGFPDDPGIPPSVLQ